MIYFVYAISSKYRNYIYVGLTNNLQRRFFQHNTGKEKTTKPYTPFDIIYFEKHANRLFAREREKYLKSGVGKEFLRKKRAAVAKLADALP